jgi:Ca2+-binding EF-hand superfamily protein
VSGASKPVSGASKPAFAPLKPFTEQELADMKIRFRGIDTDGNGLLSPEELTHFAIIYDMDPHFVGLAFLVFDGDNNGGLDFDEFVEFMNFARNFDRDKRGFFRRVFQAIDKDNRGSIDGVQLQKLGEVLGNPMTLEEAIGVVKSLDFTGTGRLIFDDFCHWLGLPRQS